MLVTPCDRGPNGLPCGRATRTPTKAPGECARCWIAQYTREELRALAVGSVSPRTTDPGPILSCIHEGAPARPPAGKDVRRRYLHCEAGKGEGGVVCRCDCNSRCDRYEAEKEDDGPLLPPSRRHLAMHVYPSAQWNTWRRCLDQVMTRRDLFTGSRHIAVVTGTEYAARFGTRFDPWEAVRDHVGDFAEVFPVENDSGLREVATWRPLWDRLLPQAADHDTAFYCHAKGVTRPVDPGNMTHRWASLMFSLCLDHPEDVASQLARHPITGCFKKVGYGFGRHEGRFHYSGTFFWVKVGDFRTRRYPISPPAMWYGVETWPGLAYDAGEAGCLYRETTVSGTDLYCPEKWRTVYQPEYDAWLRARQEAIRSAGGSSTTPSPR